jgi:hypothetical protein
LFSECNGLVGGEETRGKIADDINQDFFIDPCEPATLATAPGGLLKKVELKSVQTKLEFGSFLNLELQRQS